MSGQSDLFNNLSPDAAIGLLTDSVDFRLLLDLVYLFFVLL